MGGTISMVLPSGRVDLRVRDWSMWKRDHPRYPDEGTFSVAWNGDAPDFVDSAIGGSADLESDDGGIVFDGMFRFRSVDTEAKKACGTMYAVSPVTIKEKIQHGTTDGNARRRRRVQIQSVDTGRSD